MRTKQCHQLVTALVWTLFSLFALSPVRAEDDALARWWNAQTVTGDVFGLRPAAEDYGLTFGGRWRAVYFGILASESGAGNSFTQELAFTATLNLAKALRWETVRGLTAFGEVRWREPGYDANPNNLVEGDRLFNPSRYAGGTGWRLMSFGLNYVTPMLFGVEEFLTVDAGWLRPQQEFVIQPVAQLFANNAMASARGLGGNIPFGSSFSSWGGTIEVKPVDWHYTKMGLYMSFPNPTDSNNNGLMFQGDTDASQNGLFFLGETGVTPEIGADRLPGHYAFGGYYYGEDNEEFGSSKFGFYWQADQMLWRESGEQGLRMFSLWVFAPKYNNDFSFYAHGGFAYDGAVPGRDADTTMIGVAVGQYSYYDLLEARADGEPEPNQSVLIEAGYRFKLNGWSFVQPFAQYIVQPDGTTAVANAAILGLFLGVNF
jgi:porin